MFSNAGQSLRLLHGIDQPAGQPLGNRQAMRRSVAQGQNEQGIVLQLAIGNAESRRLGGIKLGTGLHPIDHRRQGSVTSWRRCPGRQRRRDSTRPVATLQQDTRRLEQFGTARLGVPQVQPLEPGQFRFDKFAGVQLTIGDIG